MADEVRKQRLHEYVIPSRRLGRHVQHDPRSLLHQAARAPKLVTVRHTREVPIFNQGQIGSCTGNALTGSLSTDPFTQRFTEDDAVAVYAQATREHPQDGVYPPDDPGSSGLAVMQVAKERGWVASYKHAFGLDHVLHALVLRPGITGITWLSGCDTPDSSGLVKYLGSVRGGHEIELVGLDTGNKLVWFANSWGTGWGKEGYFCMSWSDYDKALQDSGDATFAVPK